jgi:hypothetical protein
MTSAGLVLSCFPGIGLLDLGLVRGCHIKQGAHGIWREWTP